MGWLKKYIQLTGTMPFMPGMLVSKEDYDYAKTHIKDFTNDTEELQRRAQKKLKDYLHTQTLGE